MQSPLPVTLVTSIPPSLTRREWGRPMTEDYQTLCIRSWKDNGFSIVSVNDAAEVESLSAKYPEVRFVAAERNSSALSGKKTPFLIDLLAAGAQSGSGVVGICNSDILLEHNAAWKEQLPHLVSNAVVMMQRHDTNSLSNGAMRVFPHGFDVFFMERTGAQWLSQARAPFALGLPWWDYWLPLALIRQGLDAKLLTRPCAVHLSHEQGYQWNVWRYLGKHFIEFVARPAEHSLPEFRGLESFCRQAAQENPSTVEMLNSWLGQIALVAVDVICNFAGPGKDFSSTQDKADLTNKIAAGPVLTEAMALFEKGKPTEAEALLKSVLEQVSDEFDALCVLGKIYLQNGKYVEAAEVFRKAIAQQPDLFLLQDALGQALLGLNAHAEAIIHFKYAVALSPGFAEGHRHLAAALEALDRGNRTGTHQDPASI